MRSNGRAYTREIILRIVRSKWLIYNYLDFLMTKLPQKLRFFGTTRYKTDLKFPSENKAQLSC